jgi:hypothetical protein
METLLAVLAALINLLAMALFHNPQSKALNAIAAGLCIVVSVMTHLRRRREHGRAGGPGNA